MSPPDEGLPHAKPLVSVSEGTSPEYPPAETGYLAPGGVSAVRPVATCPAHPPLSPRDPQTTGQILALRSQSGHGETPRGQFPGPRRTQA